MKSKVVAIIIFFNSLLSFIPKYSKYSLIGNIFLSILLLLLLTLKRKKIEISESTLPESESEVENRVTELSNTTKYKDWVLLDPRGEDRPKTCHNCTESIYYITNYIPIIEKLTLDTLKNEESSMNDLFTNFQEISDKTDLIVQESKESITSIFDPKKGDNLAHVLDSSKEITKEFNIFIDVIKDMSRVADNFINTSIDSFNYISKTTKDIIDLSEQVKVISINVRIEAARVKDSGGFKVLGNDISNFADKTSMVALSTNEQIKETINDIIEQKENLLSQLKSVESLASSIFNKVSPFEGILSSSAGSIKDVIEDFNTVSTHLQENLKNSIVNMQHQDISSQEINHILKLLNKIKESGLLDRDFDLYLSDQVQNEIKIEILEYLNEISTTINEEREIYNFSKKWGVEIKDKYKNLDNPEGDIVLF